MIDPEYSAHALMHLPKTDKSRIVVIGGGFAGISVVKALKNKDVQVVLIDKNNFHQFQPLFYQVATCGLEPDGIVFPLRKMFNGFDNTFFRLAEVKHVETEKNMIHTSIGKLSYDYLVLAMGSTTNFFGMPDVEEYAIGMKDIREALDIRSLILQSLEQAVITEDDEARDLLTNFAIIGGGPAGVEMAGSIAEFRRHILPNDYSELNVKDMRITLVEAGSTLLSTMSRGSSEKALKYLDQLGVEVLFNTAVTAYDGTYIQTNTERVIGARTAVWTAGVKANVTRGFQQEDLGKGQRMKVDLMNRLVNYNNIYAIGDMAIMESDDYPDGHPMVAQPALQQGKLLGQNLWRMINDQPLKAFDYNDKGSLATIGKKKAVADLNKLHFGGNLAWLLWSVVHLMSIAGFRNRILVGLNWVWSYFTYDKGNRLIIRSARRHTDHEARSPVLSE